MADLAAGLRAHMPTVLHSAGVVCQCGRVLTDADTWAAHVAKVVLPSRRYTRRPPCTPHTEAEWDDYLRDRAKDRKG